MARYNNGNERGVIANLGGNNQVGTYANKYGDVGAFWDRGNTPVMNAGLSVADDNTMNIGGRMAFPATQNFYNEIDTPVGMFAYGSNAADALNPNGQVYADFTPRNQYYIQALANLLRGRL